MDLSKKCKQLVCSSDISSVKLTDEDDLSDSSLPETVENDETLKHLENVHSRTRIVFLCSVCDYYSCNEEDIKCHTEEHRQLLCAPYELRIVISRDENDSEENESSSSSFSETVLNADVNTRTEKLPSIARIAFRCLVCEYYSYNKENIKRHTNEHADNSLSNLRPSFDSSIIGIRPQADDELTTEKVNVDCLYKCNECPYETHAVKKFSSHLNAHGWLKADIKVKNDLVPDSEKQRYFFRYRSPKVKKYGNLLTEQIDTDTPHAPDQPQRVYSQEQFTHTKFFCEHCPFSCNESCTLFRHQAVHAAKSQPHRETTKTSPEIFHCFYNNCSFFCEDIDLLKRHQEFHQEKLQTLFDQNKKEPKFICRMCGFSCAEKEQIVLHESVHSESYQNLKNAEQMIVSRKEQFFSCSMSKDVEVHDEEQFFSCSMSKDVEVHDEPKQNEFLCCICGGIFHTEKQLESHEMSHNSFSDEVHDEPKQNEFLCCICGGIFPTEKQFESHEMSHNSFSGEYDEIANEPQIFKCTESPISDSLKHRDLHQPSHDVKYKCLYCGKEYRRQLAFKKHMKMCKHNT